LSEDFVRILLEIVPNSRRFAEVVIVAAAEKRHEQAQRQPRH